MPKDILHGSILEAYHQARPIRKKTPPDPEFFTFAWQVKRKTPNAKWRTLPGETSATLHYTPELTDHEVRMIIHPKKL